MSYDAILFVSFGGPEGPDDVMPFLENVLRGRNVPRERMLEVAEHYKHYGGVSPINSQNRALIAALENDLTEHGVNLPVYFGNRNWNPMMDDTMRKMKADGVKRAIAFVTSAFSCYSGCRQYRENICASQDVVGEEAPVVDKLRVYYNHPGFVEPMIDNVNAALKSVPENNRATTQLVFTAHSIPMGMATNSKYEWQLTEACRLVAEGVGTNPHRLVYQSRSGPPQMPWLEPDVCDYIKEKHAEKPLTDVVIIPIGFISDHMEVMYDLDDEAKTLCDELGINMQRASTVGTDPRFVTMIRQLVEERISESPVRLCLGDHGPSHDVCPEDCCMPGARPTRPGTATPKAT